MDIGKLDANPRSTVKYFSKKASSKVINEYKGVDSWFWLNGSLNPFRGCEHNCAFCDGRADYYRIDNFSSHITVKTDSHHILRKELRSMGFISSDRPSLDSFFSKSENAEVVKKNFLLAVGGGVCDVYQPAEREFQITRKILKVIKNFSIPISILTKSKLVLRDLPIISGINSSTYASVNFSIALMDDQIRKIFEPSSASINDRFSTLKKFREAKIHGGVMAMPILPWIGDNEENIRGLIKESKHSKAEFILPSSLTLKPGRNKKLMFSVVKRHFPDIFHLYVDLYKKNNKYGIPNGGTPGYININKLVHEFCRKYRLSDRIPRFIPPIENRNNLIVSTIFHNLSYYLQYISEEPWSVSSKYANLGRAIENSSKNIQSLTRADMVDEFKLDNDQYLMISEIMETGELAVLNEFQDPKTMFIFQ